MADTVNNIQNKMKSMQGRNEQQMNNVQRLQQQLSQEQQQAQQDQQRAMQSQQKADATAGALNQENTKLSQFQNEYTRLVDDMKVAQQRESAEKLREAKEMEERAAALKIQAQQLAA